MKQAFKKPYFAVLWQKEIEMDATPVEKTAYIAIKSYSSNGKKAVDLSFREISARSGLSIGHIKENIDSLISKGFIEIAGKKARRGGTVSIYKCSLAEQLEARSVPRAGISVPRAGFSPQGKRQSKKVSLASSLKKLKKPKNCSQELWDKALSVIKIRTEEGTDIKKPSAYILPILKSEATTIGDHKYLASLMTNLELKALADNPAEGRDQSYGQEALKRSLI